jgi:hypothetical protein
LNLNVNSKAAHPLLETPKFAWCQGVGLANDRNHIDTWRETAHQLDIDLPQPETMSDARLTTTGKQDPRVSSGRDKVEKGVDTIVPETGVTLDARFFGQNVVVLTLEVANYFLKAVHGNYTYVFKERS